MRTSYVIVDPDTMLGVGQGISVYFKFHMDLTSVVYSKCFVLSTKTKFFMKTWVIECFVFELLPILKEKCPAVFMRPF
jgi:hypothetical protein